MKLKEKNNVLKKSKGITLVALVVTIIVLIILAGVSISLVLGDNGIVTKSQEAKENYQVAANEEQQTLANLEVELGTLGGDSATSPTVEYAPYDKPYAVEGYTHFGTEDWNSGYRISDTGDETGNIFVWVPCVTDQNKVKEGDTVVTFGKFTEGQYNQYSYGLSTTDTTIIDEEPTNAIKQSVEKYGGFYIAAYEAGIEEEKNNYDLTTRIATDGTVKPLSKSGKYLWNYISITNAIIVAESMVNTTDGVKSGLISGECWDTTLQWMVNTSSNKEINVGYDTNSTGKGWYSDVSADESGTKTTHTTGYYGVNNIYDMAGNVLDITTEKCTSSGDSYCVLRGGLFTYPGSFWSAASRITGADEPGYDTAFRVVLYK